MDMYTCVYASASQCVYMWCFSCLYVCECGCVCIVRMVWCVTAGVFCASPKDAGVLRVSLCVYEDGAPLGVLPYVFVFSVSPHVSLDMSKLFKKKHTLKSWIYEYIYMEKCPSVCPCTCCGEASVSLLVCICVCVDRAEHV